MYSSLQRTTFIESITHSFPHHDTWRRRGLVYSLPRWAMLASLAVVVVAEIAASLLRFIMYPPSRRYTEHDAHKPSNLHQLGISGSLIVVVVVVVVVIAYLLDCSPRHPTRDSKTIRETSKRTIATTAERRIRKLDLQNTRHWRV
jgi:hypothetical protein